MQQHVLQCQNWCIEQHAWSAVTHDFADLFPACRGIAVCRAYTAEGLGFHMGTMQDALLRIVLQFLTGRAETGSSMVLSMSIDGENLLYGFELTGSFGCKREHGRHPFRKS